MINSINYPESILRKSSSTGSLKERRSPNAWLWQE